MKQLLICFDVDGTLIDDTIFIWQTLHDRIQTDPAERKFWSDAYWSKRITYEDWARKDVEMWMRKNVTRDSLWDAMNGLRLMEGAQETLGTLKNQGHYLGIISGSLNIAIEKTLPGYAGIFNYVFLNALEFDASGRLSGIVATPFDIEHKASGLIEMAKRLDMPLADTVFIGDNFNDIEVAKIAGCSIAFNCKSDELCKVARHQVDGTDIRKVLPIIDAYSNRAE
jgi:HAD superfamily phosphoserine phosphatase-like hydrolase